AGGPGAGSATAQPPPGTAGRRHLRRLRPAAHAGPFRQPHPDPRPFPAARRGALRPDLCRNVLIYFEPALARQVTELLSSSLRPGGTILLGVADVLPVSPGRSRRP